MNYSDYERAFSAVRLAKYRAACGDDSDQAINLYRYNIGLCQKFYALLNIFEVALRNAIDRHYREHLREENWILRELAPGGVLGEYTQKYQVEHIIECLHKQGKYSQDRLVSSVSLGVWIYLFTKVPYFRGGQNLLKVFPQRSPGMGQKAIYKELLQIKDFRNKVAHHEGICFDREGNKNIGFARYHYGLILKYLEFLGFETEELLERFDVSPYSLFGKIDEI